MQHQLITISKGPRFTIPFSGFLLMACIGFLIFGIDQTKENPIQGLGLIFLCIVLLPIFLDYQGIQFDLSNQNIRAYKSYFGLKRGKWVSLQGFNEVALKWERLSHRSGGSLHRIIPTGSVGVRGKTNDVFSVYLINLETKTRFEVADFQTYKAAQKFQRKISKSLQIPSMDYYEPILIAAQARREEIESRRKSK